MKFTKTDYRELKKLIKAAADKIGNQRITEQIDFYQKNPKIKNYKVALMWEFFWGVGGAQKYRDSGYNDDHINTAILKIGKELNII